MATLAVALPLDEVIEGMEVDADVLDGVGRVLVRAGTPITEKHLRIFRMCGIQDVRVRREVTEEEAAPDLELMRAREEAEALLLPRFHRTDLEHSAVAALFAACVERAVKRARWGGNATHA